MFNFSKSGLGPDLQNKTDVQYKVLCDWLRSIHAQNIQLARKLTILQNLLIEDQSSSPSGELMEERDDSSESRSVS